MGSEYWTKARGEKILPIERSLLYSMAEYVGETFEYDRPTIVNIGVSWGASVHCLHAGAPDARLIAIDKDLETRPVQGIEHLEGVKFVEDDSTMYLFDEPVHLLFIDGGHEYETVRSDIANWIPRIPLGGIIAFHDFEASVKDARRLAGVRQAVQDWRKFDGGNLWQLRWSAGSIVAYQRVKRIGMV